MLVTPGSQRVNGNRHVAFNSLFPVLLYWSANTSINIKNNSFNSRVLVIDFTHV